MGLLRTGYDISPSNVAGVPMIGGLETDVLSPSFRALLAKYCFHYQDWLQTV